VDSTPLHLEMLEGHHALACAPLVERYAAEAVEIMEQLGGASVPAGLGRRFLERVVGDPAGLVLAARNGAGGADLGLLIAAPFEDPLLLKREPMIVLLHVDASVRHRGLARVLVERAVLILRQRGFARVAARAAHNDDALISMGERFGFVRQWELMLLGD
jgi:GNAT superfamily N-acetyltransferase